MSGIGFNLAAAVVRAKAEKRIYPRENQHMPGETGAISQQPKSFKPKVACGQFAVWMDE
jgi:hypothetical protein